MTDQRWQFEKVGLGYRLWPTDEDLNAELRINRIKRRSGELVGSLQVRCNFEGVKTINGVLHSARFNMSASGTRKAMAKTLKERTPGFEDMDWFDALEHLCQWVEAAEAVGEPVQPVGTDMAPARRPAKYSLNPLVPINVASLLYGPGGAGKSVAALAGALSVALGEEIIPGIVPSISGPVLYLDWETDQATVNDRLWSLCVGASVQPANVSYRRCNRPLADDAEDLAMLVAERKIVYIVIDSCGPAMGTSGEYGDANESTLRLFEAIRHIGVSTQIIDHVSKQEMRSAKGKVTGLLPYGSIYKVNLARAAWELRNVTSEDDDTLRITLFNTKANDSRLHDPINLSIDWEGDSITFHTELDAPSPVREIEGDGWKERLIEYLSEEAGAVESSQAARDLNMPRNAKGEVDTGIIRSLISRFPAEFSRPRPGSSMVMLTPRGGIDNVVTFMPNRGPEA